jgi:hypothetical protein
MRQKRQNGFKKRHKKDMQTLKKYSRNSDIKIENAAIDQ